MRGKLIAFEGLDGSGKTTQIDLLQVWLGRQTIPFLRTCEPGGTDLGVEIRKLLLGGQLDITPLAEAFLFQADRAHHFAAKISPALALGTLVVTDRCFYSSIVYQGIVRGMGVDLIEQLSLLATGGITPDLTIYLDLDVALAHSRKENPDRFDAESEAFQSSLRQGYLSLASASPDCIKVVDASRDMRLIHEDIVSLVLPLLS